MSLITKIKDCTKEFAPIEKISQDDTSAVKRVRRGKSAKDRKGSRK